MSENIVLKYRREFDCWVCNECDIENANTQKTCIVCNSPRPVNPNILKAWTPMDDAPVQPNTMPQNVHAKQSPPQGRPSSAPGPMYHKKAHEKYVQPATSSGMSATLIWTLVIIAIFIFIIALNKN